MKGTHLIKKKKTTTHFSLPSALTTKLYPVHCGRLQHCGEKAEMVIKPLINRQQQQTTRRWQHQLTETMKKGGKQEPEHWVTIVLSPQLAHCSSSFCSNVLSAGSAFSKQRASDRAQRWCRLGHNVSSLINSGIPAAYTRSLVTLEPQRADTSQYNKGRDKNTSKLDCVTMQYFSCSVVWMYGVLVNWMNNLLIPKRPCKRQKAALWRAQLTGLTAYNETLLFEHMNSEPN